MQTLARSASAEVDRNYVAIQIAPYGYTCAEWQSECSQNASQHTCRAALMTVDVVPGAQDTSKR